MQNSKLNWWQRQRLITDHVQMWRWLLQSTVMRMMRMKSQPQLATRWLWSFAFYLFWICFAVLCFESILPFFVLNPFRSKLVLLFLVLVLNQLSFPFVLNLIKLVCFIFQFLTLLFKKSKVCCFKIILLRWEYIVWFLLDWFVYYFGDLYLLLKNLLILSHEICFFSVRRFLSSWGQYFVLGKEIRLFSFFLWREIRILDWFVFCFRLRGFSSQGGLFYLKKMMNIILRKYSQFYEQGERSLSILVSWPRRDFEEIFWDSGISILAIRCWAWSQICCERGSSPGGRMILWIKIRKSRTTIVMWYSYLPAHVMERVIRMRLKI